MKQPPPAFAAAPAAPSSWASSKPPLLRFLDTFNDAFSLETGGVVADYIPELG
jgi:glutaminase